MVGWTTWEDYLADILVASIEPAGSSSLAPHDREVIVYEEVVIAF
jgi:hypothetical protein